MRFLNPYTFPAALKWVFVFRLNRALPINIQKICALVYKDILKFVPALPAYKIRFRFRNRYHPRKDDIIAIFVYVYREIIRQQHWNGRNECIKRSVTKYWIATLYDLTTEKSGFVI